MVRALVVPKKAPMLNKDRLACRRHIALHSRSFYLASWLLPRSIRADVWALYAFCRQADDAVDGSNPGDGTVPGDAPDPEAARVRVEWLKSRLKAVYAGEPGRGEKHAIDRAFHSVISRYGIPKRLPEMLLEAMEVDTKSHLQMTKLALYEYCFGVASTVGLMMTWIMGYYQRNPFNEGLWRQAVHLGVAMQLTNIARDVGEDARRGRVYLPDDLLAKHHLCAEVVRSQAETDQPASDNLRAVVRDLLDLAEQHYQIANFGIESLEMRFRRAIRAASRIYRQIGKKIAELDYDTLHTRAKVSGLEKLRIVYQVFRQGSTPAINSLNSGPAGPADAVLGQLIRHCGLLDD